MQEVLEKPTTLLNFVNFKISKQEKKRIARGSLKLLNPDVIPKTILNCPKGESNPIACEIRYVILIFFFQFIYEIIMQNLYPEIELF